jgi:hypothetical protein
MPFTVTNAKEGQREGITPSGLRAGSLAHAAHTRRSSRSVFLMGIARSRCGHPLFRERLESADAFFTRWNYRAWD